MKFEEVIALRLKIDSDYLETHSKEGHRALEKYLDEMQKYADPLFGSRKFKEEVAPGRVTAPLLKAHRIYVNLKNQNNLHRI